jgi:hypothetical protein
MKYTRVFEFELNIGDTVECLTQDGWLGGTVEATYESSVDVYVDAIDQIRNFAIHLVRVF